MSTVEKELDVLEVIHRSTSSVRQREIARTIGLSLGMTNAILKRLATKGWLSVRRANSRNIQYVVSPNGIEEIARRSYQYLRRTIGNIVRYREAIERLVRQAKERGCTAVVLIGESELDFIVEHACAKYELAYRNPSASRPLDSCATTLVLMPETCGPDELARASPSIVGLRDVLSVVVIGSSSTTGP